MKIMQDNHTENETGTLWTSKLEEKGDAEATGNFIIASNFPVMIFSTITLLSL